MVVWNDFQTTFFLYKNRCPDNSDNDKDTYNVASRSLHETSNPDIGHYGTHEPLAQVRNWTNEDGESDQQTLYFHCDQIGISREMTDKDGNLLWYGEYTGWGRLKEETRVTDSACQPFQLGLWVGRICISLHLIPKYGSIG